MHNVIVSMLLTIQDFRDEDCPDYNRALECIYTLEEMCNKYLEGNNES